MKDFCSKSKPNRKLVSQSLFVHFQSLVSNKNKFCGFKEAQKVGGGEGIPKLAPDFKSSLLQANCIDSTASAEAVFASEVKKMQQENMKPQEQLTLEPYERDHAVVVGVYR